MCIRKRRRPSDRRGAILVLSALLLVVLVGMAAFAVDLGYICVVRNQLQVAADSAAMAAAGELNTGQTNARNAAKLYAGANIAGGPTEFVSLSDSDITFGLWDSTARTFTPTESGSNSLKIVAHKTQPLFFGRVLGVNSVDLQATAVALANCRDIAFVVDLSGSMNNDTEIWATNAINSAFPGYPTIGSDLIAAVYSDFGFGSYPGTLNHVAQGLPGAPTGDTAYGWLANTYLLNNMSVPSQYRTLSGDSSSTRKTKTYKWIIDYQLAAIMPAAQPTPSSATNLAYWTAYLDYIIKPYGGLPPNQNSYRINGAGNPYTDAWPDLTSSSYSGFYNKLGYQTYVQFMMDYGWNKTVTTGVYVPLSRLSPYCPWRLETDPTSPGYGLSFPPREQPTHAARMAIMAAIDRVAEINADLPEASKDHVCLITFDTASGCSVKYPLSVSGCDYQAVKAAARNLQAVADDAASTGSENGLILARDHLDPAKNPTGARPTASKFVIFLSDGIPNIKKSSSTTISNYMSQNPDGEWFTSGDYSYERNAVLMQIAQLEAIGWKTFAVGIGLGADRSLMDRMARMAGTGMTDPNNPTGPKISPYAEGNPADYQTRLTAIFNTIVGSPFVRLAK